MDSRGSCPSTLDGCQCRYLTNHAGLHFDGLVHWDDEDADEPAPTPKQREEREEMMRKALIEAYKEGHDYVGPRYIDRENSRYWEDLEDEARIHADETLNSLRTHSPEERDKDGLADRLDALFRSLIRNGADPAVVGEAGSLVHRLLQHSPEDPLEALKREAEEHFGDTVDSIEVERAFFVRTTAPVSRASKVYQLEADFWPESVGDDVVDFRLHRTPDPIGQPLDGEEGS